MKKVVAVILAGGKGARLEPLTRDRAKPAVPFGGIYRIVDFALSNCLNSGIRKMLLLTQYKAMSLDRHINRGWRNYFCHELGEFIDVVPPQQRIDEHWYQGTADAVYQNIYSLEKEHPEHVVILAGDHIYKMNYSAMLKHHMETNADLTIGALQVSVDEAREFGVMQVDASNNLVGFQEKPDQPMPVPGCEDQCLASMGIYIFSSRVLFEMLCRDANLPHSSHDFGRDIIPSMIESHRVVAYPFECINGKSKAYWRDVGTLDAYYEANMDLVSVEPQLNLYDGDWPIRTWQASAPPPKFVFGSKPDSGSTPSHGVTENNTIDIDGTQRIGYALDSIVCSGTVVSGARVQRCVIGSCVRLNENAIISDSILFDNVIAGKDVTIRRAIIDKDVEIPDGTRIGVDLEMDRQRGFTVTKGGVVVIAKGDRIFESDTESRQRDPTMNVGPSDNKARQRWHVKHQEIHDRT